MSSERLQEIRQMIEQGHKHMTSPAEDAILDICAALLDEIAMLADVSTGRGEESRE